MKIFYMVGTWDRYSMDIPGTGNVILGIPQSVRFRDSQSKPDSAKFGDSQTKLNLGIPGRLLAGTAIALAQMFDHCSRLKYMLSAHAS